MTSKGLSILIRFICNIAVIALAFLLVDDWWEAAGYLALVIVVSLNTIVVLEQQAEEKKAQADAEKYRAGLKKEGPWQWR